MAQPVWVLSVDLQAKTATFQTGMADAARSARGAFTDIKSGSGEMGREVGGNMMEARHGVMMLGEEFGVHLPRALTSFIASIGPVGAAMEAAFPFLAIATGATLLIEHLAKMREEGQKLTEDQARFGTAVQNAFNTLDQKLLQSQIHADELRNDHLGALHKQLELIDKQSMSELAAQFETVVRTADTVFSDLKRSWYQFSTGSAGAKASLDEFKLTYDDLLSHGKGDEAAALLQAKMAREQHILAMVEQKTANHTTAFGHTKGYSMAKDIEATNELKRMGVKFDKDALASAHAMVTALDEQFGAQQRLADIKKQDQANAKTTANNESSSEHAARATAAAEHKQKMGELALAGEREQANESLTLHSASIAERLASDTEFANKEYAIQQAANRDLIAALDKSGKDYNNQLRALHAKAEEEAVQHANTLGALTAKAAIEQQQRDVDALQQGEREQIEATQQGSTARLAAIDAAIKEEQAHQLEASNFFRELQTQRVETVRQAAIEEAKLAAEAGKEMADHSQKMGELALAAQKEHQALMDSAHRVSIQHQLEEEIQAANQENALKMAALREQEATLDKSAKDYENKLREIQDKERQLVQEHENEITAIKDKAEMERNARILAADQHLTDALASGMAQVLMGHKSFAATMNSIGNQVVGGMMENAIKSVMANDFTKESDAAAAARKAYLAGMHFPFPANIVMGPALGALAFASVMAFQTGTDSVPGFGSGDKVPAMLEPGEGVVPGGVMDGLRSMARSGSMGGGNSSHVHYNHTYHLHALDDTGMEKVLKRHSATLQKHFETTLRKMNR